MISTELQARIRAWYRTDDATKMNADPDRPIGSASGAIADGATVLQWYDTVTNRYMDYAAVPSLGFAYKLNGALGAPCLDGYLEAGHNIGFGRRLGENAIGVLPELLAAQSYTLLFLVYKRDDDRADYFHTLCSNVSGGYGRFQLFHMPDGTLRRADSTGGAPLSLDAPHGIAYTFAQSAPNTGTSSFYIDDATAPAYSETGTVQAAGADRLVLGSFDGNKQEWNGEYYEFIAVEGACSNVEIAEFFNDWNTRYPMLDLGVGVGPLTAGTLNSGAKTKTTQSVSSTPAIGGTGGNTYQWHRSATNGSAASIAVPGNLIGGATELILNDTGLTPQTQYFYVLKTTDNSGTSVLSIVLASRTHGNTTVKFEIHGDSTDVVTPAGERVPTVFARLLFDQYNNLDPQIANYASSGRQMKEIAATASTVADAMVTRGTQYVRIRAGINDALRQQAGDAGFSPDNYKADLLTFVNAVTAKGIPVYVDQITYVNTDLAPIIASYNAQIATLNWGGLLRQGQMTAYAVWALNPSMFLTFDNVHQNGVGIIDLATRQVTENGAQINAEQGGVVGPGDTTAPILSNFTATAGNAQVLLAATSNEKGSINLKRDGAQIQVLPCEAGIPVSYLDTGRTNGTAHSYTATPFDEAGNEGDESAAIVVTPTAPVVVPPTGKVPVRVTYEFNGSPVADALFSFRLIGLADAFFIGVALQDTSQTLTTTIDEDVVELVIPSEDGFWLCEGPNGEAFQLDLSDATPGVTVDLKDVRVRGR